MSTPPPCSGRHVLFDSTFLADHLHARQLCLGCPLIQPCRERLADAQRKSYTGGRPEGTWAGELITDSRDRTRITIEDARWTDDDAREARNRWEAGERTDRNREGARVYARRMRRSRRAGAA